MGKGGEGAGCPQPPLPEPLQKTPEVLRGGVEVGVKSDRRLSVVMLQSDESVHKTAEAAEVGGVWSKAVVGEHEGVTMPPTVRGRFVNSDFGSVGSGRELGTADSVRGRWMVGSVPPGRGAAGPETRERGGAGRGLRSVSTLPGRPGG